MSSSPDSLCSRLVACAVSPAYSLETFAFNPEHQPTVCKNTAARITTAVAPILFLYQVALHGVMGCVDLPFTACGCSSGIVAAQGLNSCLNSAYLTVSSFLEIPQKLWRGHQNPPNYFNCERRYEPFEWFPKNK